MNAQQEILNNFSKSVRIALVDLDMTQQDLADYAGLSVAYINSLLKGKKSFSTNKLCDLDLPKPIYNAFVEYKYAKTLLEADFIQSLKK